MEKKVSIIIPVYNSEKYLAECLGNVVHQTLEDIEILLINDASTDQSIKILQDCEKLFPDKVIVIDSKVNRGPGGARNLGLKKAIGEYIGFVDSDDLVQPDMFEKMYRRAKENNYDIVDCGYYNEASDQALLHTADELTGKLNGKKRSELIVSGGYIYSRIFKRSLLYGQEKLELSFREGVILEDSDFLTYLFSVAESIGTVKEILYCYKNRGTSASKVCDTEKYYRNITEAMNAVFQKTHELGNYEEIRDAVEYEILQMYSYGVNSCLKELLDGMNRDKEQRDEEQEAKQQIKCSVLDKLLRIKAVKQKIVTGSYENSYVRNKIASQDIKILELNDKNPENLIKMVCEGKTFG